jgi:hypothetical protein
VTDAAQTLLNFERSAPPEHREAMLRPRPGFEAAIVGLYKSLAEYAAAAVERYESTVGEDGYIGEAWERICDGLIDLLNGETGRLSCATLDASIRFLRESGGSALGIQRVREETRDVAPKSNRRDKAKAQPEVATPIGQRRLNDRERELLGAVSVVNNIANYTGTDRVPDWKFLKGVMLALGGKWKTKTGFVFEDDVDAAEVVRLAQTSGEILDARTADFFPTPLALVDLMIDRAEFNGDESVLEPSAGQGAIAGRISERFRRAHILCFEALEQNSEKLIAFAGAVITGDFLDADPKRYGPFDRVLMNPPFSKRNDIKHIEHAFQFLKPGGVLVAIASSGVLYRDDKLAKEFRQFVGQNEGKIWENPAGSFKESGTMVGTVMVRMRRAA